MSVNNRRIQGTISRDLYVLEDENNPRGSQVENVLPSTILDQVYDDQSPTKKNLRTILEELRQEIITGGRGNIKFPVTSVNGMTDDVIINKKVIGLGDVDNTKDIDKPLSTPQRNAVMQMLETYDFDINLDDLYKHLMNTENPHDVTVDQINKNDSLAKFVKHYIGLHNTSQNVNVHPDLRGSLRRLWTLVDGLNDSVDSRVEKALDVLYDHIENENAHINLLNKKEDKSNKVMEFYDNTNSNHTNYPSTRAVVEFVTRKLIEFNIDGHGCEPIPDENIEESLNRIFNGSGDGTVVNPPSVGLDHTAEPIPEEVIEESLNKIFNGYYYPGDNDGSNSGSNSQNVIADIKVIDTREELPEPTHDAVRKVYFIRKGQSSFNEIAICKINYDNTCSWDISTLGSYSKYDDKYFADSEKGLSLNIGNLVDSILDENGILDVTLSETLEDYYTADQIDKFKFVNTIKILPGTTDGTIRFYTNNDVSTMSEDIKVAGLKRLAYLEFVTEDEIWDNAVHERHILNKAVARKHIQDKAIIPDHIECEMGFIIGNDKDPDDNKAHYISLQDLANYLRPLIGGWPDPTTPGGNPWYDCITTQLLQTHTWKSGVEYSFGNGGYAARFTGTISCLPNMSHKLLLTQNITVNGDFKLMDAGGSWMYQSEPDIEWTILGGSNITGHTFATITMDKNGLYLETISVGNRISAPFDIWIKYVKPTELNNLLTMEPGKAFIPAGIPGPGYYDLSGIPKEDIKESLDNAFDGVYVPDGTVIDPKLNHTAEPIPEEVIEESLNEIFSGIYIPDPDEDVMIDTRITHDAEPIPEEIIQESIEDVFGN